jgi:hypothetical protein
MAHTYMIFDFPGEETAQQARHKLETWKQAFRLDKKLQYKLDRGEKLDAANEESGEDEAEQEAKPAVKTGKSAKAAKPGKSSKSKGQAGTKADEESAYAPADSGPVKVLVRLYFSGHEKMSEKRILDKINGDELFKGAAQTVAEEGQAGFVEALAEFDRLGGADKAFGG